MKRPTSSLVIALATAAIALAAAVAPASVAASDGQSGLAALRAATAAFHDVHAAEAAGYASFYVCTAEPGQGAMGQHFVNGSLLGTLDPTKPQALVYEPTANGYKLVAVEFVVIAAGWDETHGAPPALFGQTFGRVDAPNRYGLPDFYELHVWAWKPNPSGMFYEWNPRVSCP